VDNQPRLRRMLETRIGPGATDLAVAVSNAAVQGLTQGTASLVVDAGQRAQALLAARTDRAAFTAREAELSDVDRPVRGTGLGVTARPVPLPPGPVERYADRAAAGSLLTAGSLLAATGSVDLAGRVLLVGAPKAARAAREAFADTLNVGLSRRGVLVLDPAVLRRLDRVDTVVVDTRVLHGTRPVVLSGTARAGHWSAEHVWSAAQRLLEGGPELPLPPPRGRHRHRLTLRTPATRAGKGVGMFAGAAVAGYFVLLFLSVAGWWSLGNAIGRGWSALVIMVIWAIIAAVLVVLGRSALAAAKGLPHTTDTVKRIPDALTPHPEEIR